jgi:HPt (histidine-containing phosphotransfer) domain-containing protein
MVDANPVNLASFAAMRHETGDDPAFVADLVESYLSNAPRLAAGMRDAAGTGRTAELARLAHELKSSSAILGADGIAALCKDIESVALQGSLDGVTDRLGQVDSEAPRVEAALRSLVSPTK